MASTQKNANLPAEKTKSQMRCHRPRGLLQRHNFSQDGLSKKIHNKRYIPSDRPTFPPTKSAFLNLRDINPYHRTQTVSCLNMQNEAKHPANTPKVQERSRRPKVFLQRRCLSRDGLLQKINNKVYVLSDRPIL